MQQQQQQQTRDQQQDREAELLTRIDRLQTVVQQGVKPTQAPKGLRLQTMPDTPLSRALRLAVAQMRGNLPSQQHVSSAAETLGLAAEVGYPALTDDSLHALSRQFTNTILAQLRLKSADAPKVQAEIFELLKEDFFSLPDGRDKIDHDVGFGGKEPSSTNGENGFNCPKCGQRFTRASNLKRHLEGGKGRKKKCEV
jgi:hypothetical protein